MSKRASMPAERRRLILEMLRQSGSVTVDQVQEQFGVSSMTARRDLGMLGDWGHLRRIHGGAVLTGSALGEQPFRTRVEQHVSAKLRLAEAVTKAIESHETVFLDSSSSSYYVARRIIEDGLPVTVITNSLPVINLVGHGRPAHVDLIGLGGEFRKTTQSFVDPGTVRAIEGLSADRVVGEILSRTAAPR